MKKLMILCCALMLAASVSFAHCGKCGKGECAKCKDNVKCEKCIKKCADCKDDKKCAKCAKKCDKKAKKCDKKGEPKGE